MKGRAKFEVQIRSKDKVLNRKDIELLESIDEYGSINKACNKLNRSFSHAQRRIVGLEEDFGELVIRKRGGSSGGGSKLTKTAKNLLNRFRTLNLEFDGVLNTDRTITKGKVSSKEGDIGIIDSEIGDISAKIPGDISKGDSVWISIRSDVVTIKPKKNEYLDLKEKRTSERNIFEAKVVRIEKMDKKNGRNIAIIEGDIGMGPNLKSLVTIKSIKDLNVTIGSNILMSFKATSITIIPFS